MTTVNTLQLSLYTFIFDYTVIIVTYVLMYIIELLFKFLFSLDYFEMIFSDICEYYKNKI